MSYYVSIIYRSKHTQINGKNYKKIKIYVVVNSNMVAEEKVFFLSEIKTEHLGFLLVTFTQLLVISKIEKKKIERN